MSALQSCSIIPRVFASGEDAQLQASMGTKPMTVEVPWVPTCVGGVLTTSNLLKVPRAAYT